MTTSSLIMIAVDLVGALVLTFGLYYRRHRRRDLIVAFLGVNIGVLAVATVLGTADVAMGLGLGLFGVLSIIRLRSSEINQREVAYYFSALAMGLIGGLATTSAVIPSLLIALILAVMWAADHPALLSRVDRKYLLPGADAARIVSGLGPGTRVLDIEGRRAFSYASVYFDTPDRLSYRLAAQPRRRRFKLRTRGYLDTGTAFLEMKTKGARGATVKERIPHPADLLDGLTDEGRDYVRESLAAIGLAPGLVDELRPDVTTEYRRTTLLLADGGRATIDTDLAWFAADGTGIALPDHVLVESKSPGRACVIDRALWRAGHRPQGISKFGTGTAALHPELPSNKWARVLRGPFSHRTALTGPTSRRRALTVKESA